MSRSTGTPRIALLPEVVRNQIAAGEVIERPASCVKELVENALDSGATRIQVDLEEGGARLVRVTDDGCGMGPDDLELAFAAHATSKLRTPDDLDHIASLGFRGEALASMGSIARCSIVSRPADAPHAYRVEVEGGRQSPVREAAGARGTCVEVRDLFYNTPARRRFLKRTSTELSRCLEVVQRIALVHEGVGFVVTHDGKRVFDVEPEMDLLARIRRTFGAELAESLVPAAAADGTTRLSGYVAPPRFARRDTLRQMWFLNGRPLRDKILSRVLREGTRGLVEEGRQPVAFLCLALDPAEVDVNVHPAKSEVRLREERRLFGFLVAAIQEAVRKTDMATPGETMLASRDRRLSREAGPELPLPPRPRAEGFGHYVVREVSGRPLSEVAPNAPRSASEPPFELPPSPLTGAGTAPAAAASLSAPVDDLRGPFLQVARTYLLRALPDGFEIVDQHALHERVTFELLRRDLQASRIEIQRYLVPELVECSRADVQLLSGHLDGLRAIGIELEPFGDGTIAVQGLPARLRNPDVEGIVRDVIDVLARTGRPPEAEDVVEEVLHRAACRSSIMAGDALDDDQIQSLLRRARELGDDQTCPHARPTRVKFSLADLEKAFHRR